MSDSATVYANSRSVERDASIGSWAWSQYKWDYEQGRKAGLEQGAAKCISLWQNAKNEPPDWFQNAIARGCMLCESALKKLAAQPQQAIQPNAPERVGFGHTGPCQTDCPCDVATAIKRAKEHYAPAAQSEHVCSVCKGTKEMTVGYAHMPRKTLCLACVKPGDLDVKTNTESTEPGSSAESLKRFDRGLSKVLKEAQALVRAKAYVLAQDYLFDENREIAGKAYITGYCEAGTCEECGWELSAGHRAGCTLMPTAETKPVTSE